MTDTSITAREQLREMLADAEEDAATALWRDIRKEPELEKRLKLLATSDALGVACRQLRIAIDKAERF